jgi:2-polyprenyl-3-methyl-5-hydroxy-6-metoxy-1,4-benzoquinol methylase
MTDIDERIEQLKPWYQTIQLDDGPLIKGHGGCGDPAWPFIKEFLEPIEGKRILDLGANAGIHAIRAAQAGAKEVVCIEAQDQYKDQFDFIYDYFCQKDGKRYNIRFIQGYVEDIPKLDLGYFDSVLAISILYHLGKLKKVKRSLMELQHPIALHLAAITDHVIVRVRKPTLAEAYEGFFGGAGFQLTNRHERSRIFMEFKR